MSLLSDDGTIEECLDQLTQTIGDLDRFAPTVLAVALRVHLEALLRTLLASHFCTERRCGYFSGNWNATCCSSIRAEVCEACVRRVVARRRESFQFSASTARVVRALGGRTER